MANIQTLSRADYKQVFDLSQFAFQYELSNEEWNEKCEEADRHTIWGWMEQGEVAAKTHLIPLSCYINGKEFAMGGISSVATWPEYRRQGMIKHLLHHALEQMRKNGLTLSYLHPFAFSFYRKYGWEHAVTRQHATIPIERLKQKWPELAGYVQRMRTPDFQLLQDVYSQYAKQWNGMLVRDRKWWEQRVLTNNEQVVVAYDSRGCAEGYVLYRVKDHTIDVRELVYLTLQGEQQLLKFLSHHESMAKSVNITTPERHNLSLILDEPRFKQTLDPYFMARIVDVKSFLQKYQFCHEGKVTFCVTDAFLPVNDGTYVVTQTATGNQVDVISTADEQTIHCSIQALTGMLLNYRRPKDYWRAGMITAPEQVIDQLEVLLPNYAPFLSDFY